MASFALDFSDDFTTNPRGPASKKNDQVSIKDFIKHERSKQQQKAPNDEGEGHYEKENNNPYQCGTSSVTFDHSSDSSSSSERMVVIRKQVASIAGQLGLTLDVDSLSSDILQCFGKIMHETDRTRDINTQLLEDSQQKSINMERKDKDIEKLKSQVMNLQQDVASHGSRTTAMQAEHREMRNHWLNEKNELENKVFQIQSLLTQTKAAVIKKDKDYEKMQNQLTKAIKDSTRGQKEKQGITISKPLPKQTSQKEQKKAVTVKDAEMLASNATIDALTGENSMLRGAVNDLTDQINNLQITFASLMAIKHQFLSAPVSLPPSSSVKTPLQKGSLVQTYLEGTPGARPAHYIIKEADVRVKMILEKSSELLLKAKAIHNDGITGDEINEVVDGNKDILNEMSIYREKLGEALAVIHEQDRLIHDALMSKLPLCNDKFADDIEMKRELDNDMGLFSPTVGIFSPRQQFLGKNGRRRSSYGVRLSLDGEELFHEFLPPASPATISLMKESGFDVVPNQRNEEDAKHERKEGELN